MSPKDQNIQSGKVPAKSDRNPESQPKSSDQQQDKVEPVTNPSGNCNGDSPADIPEPVDSQPSNNKSTQSVIKAQLTKDYFEMILSDSSDKATDIIANIDYHAFFVEDEVTGACLDQYHKATASLRPEDSSGQDSSAQYRESSGLYLPLVARLRHKTAGTKVLFTDKRRVPADLCIRERKYIGDICKRLGFSDQNRKLIQVAGEIHNLAKLQHPDHSRARFTDMVIANKRFLSLLDDHPALVKMLRLMYCSLKKSKHEKPSTEIMGANVISIVDLVFDTMRLDGLLTGKELLAISRALRDLTSRLFLKEVVEALISILEDELSPPGEQSSNRVVIYSDRPERVYALEKHLKNEGFQAVVSKALKSFVTICKRQHPDIIILRLQSSPSDIVKVLHNLSNNGIDIKAVPAFLIVRGTVVRRLTSLLEMGFVDILDLDSNLDVLVLKIKKVRAKFETSPKSMDKTNQQQSGSRGNLSDMNLIDLMQALGPSQRTSRITVTPEDNSSDPLLIYLAQGNIIFAQLGNLLGESAIYRALAWQNGTWVVEQVDAKDLPEPNNTLPNEFILMEGCRLLDENSQKAGAG
jgi:CheY-like chemotaxis protein